MKWIFRALRVTRFFRRPSLWMLVAALIACQGCGTATAFLAHPSLAGLSALLNVLPTVPATVPLVPTRLAAFPTLGPTSAAITGAHCKMRGPLPDSVCTPGAIDPRVTQANLRSTICKSGYTSTVRPPVSVTEPMKLQSMREYGFTDSPSNYEYDHFVALECAGNASDPKNLFPQPYAGPYGAHDKDKVENYLNAQICSGKMLLADAQHAIMTDWVAVYTAMPASAR